MRGGRRHRSRPRAVSGCCPRITYFLEVAWLPHNGSVDTPDCTPSCRATDGTSARDGRLRDIGATRCSAGCTKRLMPTDWPPASAPLENWIVFGCLRMVERSPQRILKVMVSGSMRGLRPRRRGSSSDLRRARFSSRIRRVRINPVKVPRGLRGGESQAEDYHWGCRASTDPLRVRGSEGVQRAETG